MKVLKHKVRRLEKTGAFPLSERGHLPMRGRAFCDHANAATLENEAKLVPNLRRLRFLYIKMNGGRRPTRDEGRQTKTNRGAGSTLT